MYKVSDVVRLRQSYIYIALELCPMCVEDVHSPCEMLGVTRRNRNAGSKLMP